MKIEGRIRNDGKKCIFSKPNGKCNPVEKRAQFLRFKKYHLQIFTKDLIF